MTPSSVRRESQSWVVPALVLLAAAAVAGQLPPSAGQAQPPISAADVVRVEEAARPRGGPFPWQLTVYDRAGNVVRVVGEPQRDYYAPAFSPDGTQLAVVQALQNAPGTDISVIDLAAGAIRRLTTGPAPRNPVWSPDGGQIAYYAYRREHGGLYRRASDGSGREELLYQFPDGVSDVHLTDWSSDGRFLVFDVSAVVWVLPLRGELAEDRRAVEVLREDFNVFGARFSPDGRWLAYVSDATGRNEVVVRAFDPGGVHATGGPLPVSRDGGDGMVHWRRDGHELCFLAPDGRVMAAEVTSTPVFATGPPRPLFQVAGWTALPRKPDDDQSGRLSRDGQRVAFPVRVPPERNEVVLATGTLQQYTGRYDDAGGSNSVVVSLEGTRLMLQEATRKTPLHAESDAYFLRRLSDGDAGLEFVRDDRGVVTHLLVDSGILMFSDTPGELQRAKWTRREARARPRGGPFPRLLTIYDRAGAVVRTVGEPSRHQVQPVLSPDGTRLAVVAMADPARNIPARSEDPDVGLELLDSVLWVIDLSTGARTQVASAPDLGSPVWSPDGRQIAYFSNAYRGYRGFYRRASDGTGPEQLLYRSPLVHATMVITDWSADGRFLAFHSGWVSYVLPLTGERTAVEAVRGEFRAFGARFSPDGAFLAYVSDETGRDEVYVRAFDAASVSSSQGRSWQVSDQGALGMIQWRHDGRELLYVAKDGGVMAVDVTTTPAFSAGVPRRLWPAPPSVVASYNVGYLDDDVGADGQQFVFRVPILPERDVVTLAPAVLAAYTGRYAGGVDADPGDAVLTAEGGQLVFQCCFDGDPPEGARKRLFLAESETVFFERGPDRDFDLQFFKDDRGVVTHFINDNGVTRTRR